MGTEKVDEMKGRTKEAAGDLTDNERMKNEGRTEQAEASAKEKVDKAADKVKDTFRK